jgi:hypothetical protein
MNRKPEPEPNRKKFFYRTDTKNITVPTYEHTQASKHWKKSIPPSKWVFKTRFLHRQSRSYKVKKRPVNMARALTWRESICSGLRQVVVWDMRVNPPWYVWGRLRGRGVKKCNSHFHFYWGTWACIVYARVMWPHAPFCQGALYCFRLHSAIHAFLLWWFEWLDI